MNTCGMMGRFFAPSRKLVHSGPVIVFNVGPILIDHWSILE
jgi:hypothetical protein